MEGNEHGGEHGREHGGKHGRELGRGAWIGNERTWRQRLCKKLSASLARYEMVRQTCDIGDWMIMRAEQRHDIKRKRWGMERRVGNERSRGMKGW